MNEFTFDADEQLWVGYRQFAFLHWSEDDEEEAEADDAEPGALSHDHDHSHDHSHDGMACGHDHSHDHDCGHDHDSEEEVSEEELLAHGIFRIDIQAGEEGPHPDQARALERFTEKEEAVSDAVLEVIRRYYMETVRPTLPDSEEIETVNDLGEVIQFQGLVVRDRAAEGEAVLGMVFATAWDEEHHLGLIVHQDRVLDIGTWEMAFIGPREEPHPWVTKTYGVQATERANRLQDLA